VLETKKIDKLTPEQEAYLPIFRQKYFEIGISTEKADKTKAEKAITEMYKKLGKKEPIYLWGDSYFSVNIFIAIIKKYISLEHDQLHGQLRGQLHGQLSDQLGGQLHGQLGDLRLEYNYTYMWGQHDAYWIAFYKFCEEIGVKYKKEDSKMLGLWDDLSQSCGWWIPYDGICFISERHEICKFEDSMLHCEDGPCVKFRDGWSVYAINGHLVNEKIVMTPELITLEEIENESNAETKRIMIDRYGTGKYLSDIDAKVIDIDSSNTFRSLIVDKNANKFLEGTDGSTERVYFMRVPNYVQTCKEAHESICGVPEDLFLMQS